MTEGVIFRGYASDPYAVRYVYRCKTDPLKRGEISRVCSRLLTNIGRREEGQPIYDLNILLKMNCNDLKPEEQEYVMNVIQEWLDR